MNLLPILALLSFAAQERPAVADLVKSFLQGDNSAGDALRNRREESLPALAEARIRAKESDRRPNLLALYYELKRAAWQKGEPEVQARVRRLEAAKVEISLPRAPLDQGISFIRESAGINLVVDPLVTPTGECTLDAKEISLKDILDSLTAQTGLDFDLRYDVVWISSPARLWSPPAKEAKGPDPLTPAQEKAARGWIAKFASDSPEDRDQAQGELKKLGPAVLPLLQEGAKSDHEETASRCRDLIRDLTPAPIPATPLANRWTLQRLAGADDGLGRKLSSIKTSLEFQEVTFGPLMEYVTAISGIQFLVTQKAEEAVGERKLTLHMKDLTLSHVLEIVTLPVGLDLRIENGIAVIYDRAREEKAH